MVEAQSQRGVDVLGGADSLPDGEAGLVYELGDDPPQDEAGGVAEHALDVLAEAREVAAGGAEDIRVGSRRRRDLDRARLRQVGERNPVDRRLERRVQPRRGARLRWRGILGRVGAVAVVVPAAARLAPEPALDDEPLLERVRLPARLASALREERPGDLEVHVD